MNATNLQLVLDSYAESLNAVPACKRRVADTDWFPAVDVSDAGDEYLIEFDLPVLKREELQISLDGDALLLVGTRLSPRSGATSLRAKRPVGDFVRRLALPPDSSSDEIYVTLQEGVLKLHVPKNTPHNQKKESRTIQSEEPDYEYIHR